MDDGTNRDVGDGQAVAGLDVRSGGGDNLVPGLQAVGRQDVAQLPVLVLHQGDERAAVGIVLQAEDLGGHFRLVPLKVDDAVLPLVTAAAMADGNSAVAVATGVLLQGLNQAALRFGLLIYAVESRNGHVSTRRGIRLKCSNSHFALRSFIEIWIRPYPRRTRWSWNRR